MIQVSHIRSIEDLMLAKMSVLPPVAVIMHAMRFSALLMRVSNTSTQEVSDIGREDFES